MEKPSRWYLKTAKKESDIYETDEEIIGAILACHAQGKISEEERNKFLQQVLETRHALEDDCKLVGIMAVKHTQNVSFSEATFEMCDCGAAIPHAYFMNQDGEEISPPFSSQDEAYEFVDIMHENEMIDEEARASLRTLVDISPLPGSPLLN